MNASFNAVQGLQAEHARQGGQRQGGENTYRAGERLENLDGYLLAVQYLTDVAAVGDHKEHTAKSGTYIGEHKGVRHGTHYVAPDCQAGFQQLACREVGRFFVYFAQRRGNGHRNVHDRTHGTDYYHRKDYRLEVNRVFGIQIVEIEPLRVEDARHLYLIAQYKLERARDKHSADAADARREALDIQPLNEHERHNGDINAGNY